MARLCAWLAERHRAGDSVVQLLAACTGSGWDGDTAVRAVETALGKSLAPPLPTPRPLFRNKPELDVGDRHVHVLLSMQRPALTVVGNMLSDEECDSLIEAARARISPSTVVDNLSGGNKPGDERTSHGLFFRRGESELIQRIERRLERFLAWPMDWGEGLQVLRYGLGAEYRPHFDYFDPESPAIARLTASGQRVATVLLYLNTPEEGGGTSFPDVQLDVAARRGNAVFFAYDRPYPTTLTRHGGQPVLAGEKWVATKWLRSQYFEEPPPRRQSD